MRKETKVLIILLLVSLSLFGCINEDIVNNDGSKSLNDEYIKLSYSLMGTGKSFNKGPVKGLNHEGLADIIANTHISFCDLYGDRFLIKNDALERFHKTLTNNIENDPDFEIDFDNMGEFAQEFQQTFGDLPDTDGDGVPDVADIDDDGDGVNDRFDDDDDNDGCLDRDEKDGNPGGETGDLTGLGRGDYPGDWNPDPVKADDPDYDPADTSANDDG